MSSPQEVHKCVQLSIREMPILHLEQRAKYKGDAIPSDHRMFRHFFSLDPFQRQCDYFCDTFRLRPWILLHLPACRCGGRP